MPFIFRASLEQLQRLFHSSIPKRQPHLYSDVGCRTRNTSNKRRSGRGHSYQLANFTADRLTTRLLDDRIQDESAVACSEMSRHIPDKRVLKLEVACLILLVDEIEPAH